MALADLERDASPDALPRLREYQDDVDRLLARTGELWPPAEDAPLIELSNRNWKLDDRIMVRDGILAKYELHARPETRTGILFPDPTCNGSHLPRAVRVTSSGKLAVVCVQFATLLEQDTDQELKHIGQQAYPFRNGFPFVVLVDERLRIVGMELVGYMFAEVFARSDSTASERDHLVRVNAAEIANQAE
jgi:hypothetical protein